MKAPGNVPLFLIGGINSPTTHSTMVGLYSAGGPVSASKAAIGVRTTTSPTYSSSPTVSGSDMSMLVRPTSLYNLSADSIYGYYTASHYRPAGLSGNRLTLQFTQRSSVYDHDTGATWFDPGLRGGGAAYYESSTWPDGALIAKQYPNHDGVSDNRAINKQKYDWNTGWLKDAMPRHADQFFIVGNIAAASADSIPNKMPEVSVDLKGRFYTQRWGTPASYFVCGINNYLSTQTYEPLYSTLRGIYSGIEPWSINKGGPQDYHCTMWVRTVSGIEDSNVLNVMSTGVLSAQTLKSRTTPCFATGYGGGAGMSFNIENDFLPDWSGLQEWSQLKVDNTPISSYTDPVNVWITKDGLTAIANAIRTESNTGIVDMLTTKLHAGNTLTEEINGRFQDSVKQTPVHENLDVFSSFRENLDPAQIWYYGRSIENESTVFTDTLSQYFTTTPTSSSDMLFWGLSSGGSHLTLRHEDRIVHRSRTILEPEQWHNVGFYVIPLTGAGKSKNTQSGIFINGSLDSLNDYYIDASKDQSAIFTPGGDSTTTAYNTPSRIIARKLGQFTANRTRGGAFSCSESDRFQTYNANWSDTAAVLQNAAYPHWVGPLIELRVASMDNNGIQTWIVKLYGSGTCEYASGYPLQGQAQKSESGNRLVFTFLQIADSPISPSGELEIQFSPSESIDQMIAKNIPGVATDDYSTGTGITTIGQSIVSYFNSRQVGVLADGASNITTDTPLVVEPSWLLYELEKEYDDFTHIYYIEHPDGYGERLSLKSIDELSIGKQVRLISSNRALVTPSTAADIGNSILVYGDTHHDAGQKKFDTTTSIYFDGTGD